ncbi:nuclear RNA export factor 2-like [Zophobas morio]|uniref:nuclear RNA export factor 2-like n=1 Tax=Zophobas morio TaxID=2755281 RepID=UPI003083700C
MALRTTAQSPNSITIDEAHLGLVPTNKLALDIPAYWHKFIISNVHGLKRNDVLKILFDYLKPLEFIPLCYTEDAEGAFFFARMCADPVEKFCSDKLTIPNPSDETQPFKLTIVLKYSSTNMVKVDLTENLLSVLQKRFKNKNLCLDKFHDDADLSEFFFLSQPKLLAFVLNVAKNLKPGGIKLSNNEIETLDAFQIMRSGSITSLDLRQNLLRDLAELEYLQHFNLTELWLEGNPLCDLYDEYNYVQQVIKYCPKIEKLDGFLLRQNGVPSFRRNFLCDVSAYEVVNHFLERYFPTYDSKNFIKLETFYQKDALFSLTADFFHKQLSSPSSQVFAYKIYSRNLLLPPHDSTRNLYIGSTEIMRLFNILPRSEHDPYSFTVDVLYHTHKCITLVVTGVFREIPNTERMLGFNRYFVLECRDYTYRIANEQMHVFNALTSQQISAFKKPSIFQEARSPFQRSQMVDTFAIITNLTKDWAKMFLEECHYNLKHAMLLFVDMYKGDKIPLRGFKNADEA